MSYADVPGRNLAVTIHLSQRCLDSDEDPLNTVHVSAVTANCLGPISFSSSITETSSTFQVASSSLRWILHTSARVLFLACTSRWVILLLKFLQQLLPMSGDKPKSFSKLSIWLTPHQTPFSRVLNTQAIGPTWSICLITTLHTCCSLHIERPSLAFYVANL